METATTRTISRFGPQSEETLTSADIHACGVDIAREWMEQDGFRILGVCWLPRYNPQIIAEREGRLCAADPEADGGGGRLRSAAAA